MEEKFEIKVEQHRGDVSWNYEAIKVALAEKMEEYRTLVYTEDTVKEAKTDVATLRKLRKEIEDKRKIIKKECLAPYEKIEAQAKELISLIDAPIGKIDSQVKEYEEKRRQEVKECIQSYMDEKFKVLPEDIAEKLKFRTYDSRWENVTTSKVTWTTAISLVLEATQKDLSIIDGLEDELKESVLNLYAKNLELADAMEKANELRRVKEKTLEAERKRVENEKRQQEVEIADSGRDTEDRNVRRAEEPNQEVEKIPVVTKDEEIDRNSVTLRIYGDAIQIDKVKKFIEYINAEYVEVV